MRTLANLAILTGSVGTDAGCGANPLRGQNNVQGASDMGAMPDILPGYQPVADDAVARALRAAPGALAIRPRARPADPGDVRRRGRRRLKALIVFGEDIAQTDPDSGHVRAAIEACELVVSQEIFLSETATLADVVLPAASFLEKDGTFTNFDRRVQRVRPALDAAGRGPPRLRDHPRSGAARSAPTSAAPTPADAFAEMASLTPDLRAASRTSGSSARARSPGPAARPTTPASGSSTWSASRPPSGKAQLAAIPYAPPGEEPDARLPDPARHRAPARALQLGHDDPPDRQPRARARGAARAAPRRRASTSGSPTATGSASPAGAGQIEVTAEVTERVSPGQAFIGFHFPEALANLLTSQAGDEVTAAPSTR